MEEIVKDVEVCVEVVLVYAQVFVREVVIDHRIQYNNKFCNM